MQPSKSEHISFTPFLAHAEYKGQIYSQSLRGEEAAGIGAADTPASEGKFSKIGINERTHNGLCSIKRWDMSRQ